MAADARGLPGPSVTRRTFLAGTAAGVVGAGIAGGLGTLGVGSAGEAVAAPSGRSPWTGFTAPRPQYPHVVIERNVPIRMDDGVIIRVDVRHPADRNRKKAKGPFPVVVTGHCYGKSLLGAMADYWRYGYVVVTADVRGTGSSGGRFGILDERERKDAYDIVEWSGTQPFSTGKVGVDGFSYLGAWSALAAATRPPHLAAANFGGAPTDIYRTFLTQGGSPASSAILWFMLELMGVAPVPFTVDTSDGLQVVGGNPNTDLATFIARLADDGSSMPFRLTQLRRVLDESNNWDNHFWQERSTDVSKIEVPSLAYSGWDDLFLRDTPRDFRKMNLPAGQKKMLIGPWTHYSYPKSIGVHNNQPVDDVLVGWFDRWLKGVDNGVDRIDPVLLWENGSEKWVGHETWPPEGTAYQRVYLSGKRSGTSKSVNDGTLAAGAPKAPGTATMRVDPTAGICSRQTVQYLGGLPVNNPAAQMLKSSALGKVPFIDDIAPCFQVDDRFNEQGALTFTTQPLRSGLSFTGPIAVTLTGSTTAADPAWVARLSDVAPDGTARPISEGALIASRRRLDPARTRKAPDGEVVEPFQWHTKGAVSSVRPHHPETYNIEIWPTSWTIKPGHRLRLTIDGAEFPHLFPSAHSPKRLGDLTTHFGPGAVSFLSVPVQKGRG